MIQSDVLHASVAASVPRCAPRILSSLQNHLVVFLQGSLCIASWNKKTTSPWASEPWLAYWISVPPCCVDIEQWAVWKVNSVVFTWQTVNFRGQIHEAMVPLWRRCDILFHCPSGRSFQVLVLPGSTASCQDCIFARQCGNMEMSVVAICCCDQCGSVPRKQWRRGT